MLRSLSLAAFGGEPYLATCTPPVAYALASHTGGGRPPNSGGRTTDAYGFGTATPAGVAQQNNKQHNR